MNNDHIAKQFDADLEGIRNRILQMGGLVERQLIEAMAGLASGDMALIDATIASDKRVNQYETELDEACNKLIVRRQPTAADLRLVVSVIKTITDLERIGDEAKSIAKRAKNIYGSSSAIMPNIELGNATRMTVEMLRSALDSFARMDISSAAEVVRKDKEVDAEYKAAIAKIVTHLTEDASAAQQCIELVFVAKAIERIGDHTKNISEHVVYMVKGRDVRHTGIEGIEREIASD